MKVITEIKVFQKYEGEHVNDTVLKIESHAISGRVVIVTDDGYDYCVLGDDLIEAVENTLIVRR